jgi:hypothetical protein
MLDADNTCGENAHSQLATVDHSALVRFRLAGQGEMIHGGVTLAVTMQ